MKAATAYKKANRVYLHASSKTSAGVWVASHPFIQVESSAPPAIMGQSLMEALNGSQDGVPHPTKWSELIAPLLEQAGVKSWTTFMRKAQCVNLETTVDGLKFIPTRNLGTSEGFEPMLDKVIELPPSTTLEQIGVDLEEAFTLCQ